MWGPDTASTAALFATRPNSGMDGKNLQIVANHFPVKYTSELMVYHYDVDMEPMRLNQDLAQMTFAHSVAADLVVGASDDKSAKRRLKKLNTKIYRIVIEEAIKRYSGPGELFDGVLPVFDGQKNLYTRKELDLEKFCFRGPATGPDADRITARIQVEVNEDGRQVTYALNIKKASKIDMNGLKKYFDKETHVVPSDAIQVLNIILGHAPSILKIPIGNSLYAPYNEAGGQRKDIGGGRQLAYGYFQSVRPEANGVSLVIDRTATALYESGILAKFIAKVLCVNREQFMAMKQFRDADRRRIEKELKGISIQVNHLTYKRKYKVIGLTKESARDVKFEYKKTDPRGKEINMGLMSVVEFYEKHYPDKCPLKFADFPCITVGNIKDPNFLPLDVCELVRDQHVSKNLTADQMVEMIRSSASQTPANRMAFIRDSAKSTIQDSKPYMKEFGISFAAEYTPFRIDARVLTPPVLLYGNSRTLNPFDGKWDVRNQQFYESKSLEHWIIISLTPNMESKLEGLERAIKESGTKLGMRVLGATKRVCLRSYTPDSINSVFQKALEVTSGHLQLIVFVITPKYQYLYESIKKVGDVDYGIVTQCIKEANLNNLKPPLMQNVMLKINTKLGGVNAVLTDIKVLRKRMMIVGVDCSHSGVGDRISRSVSACVASFDDSYVKYFATTRLQRRVQEITTELQEMMLDLLREYANRNNGNLPEQIIVYRDGVSEGQFNAALQQEIKGLAQTFAKEKAGYEPKFFPMNANQGVGRAKNVPPGLVVDTDVVSKTHFDYFMCSHEGIQGTSRPTHYFILWDDNKFSADQLQQLTFSLTHIYARCTRSISYPAPIAYAHLAAYRSQRHIIGYKQSDESDSGSFGGSSTGGSGPRRPGQGGNDVLGDKITVKDAFKSQMYFC